MELANVTVSKHVRGWNRSNYLCLLRDAVTYDNLRVVHDTTS